MALRLPLHLVACLAALWTLVVPCAAQVRLAARTEAQLGDLPGSSAGDLATVYHRLDLDWALGDWQVGARGESFAASAAGRTYLHLAQRSLRYQRGRLSATAGNFYAILGSGLLLRAFALPGVLSEDRVFRRRYQLSRDLDGAHLHYRGRAVDWQVLYGVPLSSDLPPGVAGLDRRRGALWAGGATLRPRPSVETGLGLLRAESSGRSEWDATAHLRLRLDPGFLYAELYGEYARRDLGEGPLFSLRRTRPRALYLSTSLLAGAWGLSLEYKDYQDFLLRHANNPPPLIREHEAFLLNRITHDILPDDEKGFQGELSYAFTSGRSLVANYTRATRRWGPGSGDDEGLREVFLQFESPLGQTQHGRLYIDWQRSRIPRKDERYLSAGALWDWRASSKWNLSADAQIQDVGRRFGSQPFPFSNTYLSLGVERAPAWSLALSWQRSTDALERGAREQGATHWWGVDAAWEMRPGQRAEVFAGRRRSGLACTAGTCYEVLGFSGVEMRLLNEFF